jgi:hypothetical protein
MAAKPFASSADLGVKEQTLEVLADGVYALTAEGDPNLGAIEGEDFLVCFEALATPVAARRWLAKLREHTDKPVRYLVLSHYHAVRVLGASAFDAEVIVSSEQTRHLIEERGQQDWESEYGRMPRLFEEPESIPGLTWPTMTFRDRLTIELAAVTPRATSSPGCLSRRSSSPATSSSPRPRSTPATRSTSTGPPAPSTGSRPWARSSWSVAAGRSRAAGTRSTPRSSRPATSCSPCSAPSAKCTAPAAPSSRPSRPPTPHWRRSTAGGPSSSTACPSTCSGCGTSSPASSARTAERDRQVWDELQG